MGNLFGANVNQSLIESIMDGMVRKDRTVDGVKTSLCDGGYCDVGLDDGWQKCDHYGPTKELTWHDDNGTPKVNTKLFPDMKAMTDHAHKLGLTAGWYANNCICRETKTNYHRFYKGDIMAMREYGFDGIKLDGCGSQLDLELYHKLIDTSQAKSGRKEILVENCHWGDENRAPPSRPNATWCPWNMYRTSYDVRGRYASVVGNLMSTHYFATNNLSYPGCWAYPDMLEVGIRDGKGLPTSARERGEQDPGLSKEEMRTHFAAWAIVSSPLILSHDINNKQVMDAIWPIISNREAIAVNQAWAGHSGSVFKSSTVNVTLDEFNYAEMAESKWPMKVNVAEDTASRHDPTVAPSFQYYYKPMEKGGAKTAVLMMNNGHLVHDHTLDFQDIPGVSCTRCHVRDVWKKRDMGDFDGTYVAEGIPAHAARFLVVTPSVTGARGHALME